MADCIQDFQREPSRSHQCLYYDKDGRRCRAWAMHNEYFCYRHRVEPVLNVISNVPFEITRLDSRAAIQQALADIAARLAANQMDLKRAGLLLYTLQIASANLGAAKTPESLPDPEPVPNHDPEEPVPGQYPDQSARDQEPDEPAPDRDSEELVPACDPEALPPNRDPEQLASNDVPDTTPEDVPGHMPLHPEIARLLKLSFTSSSS